MPWGNNLFRSKIWLALYDKGLKFRKLLEGMKHLLHDAPAEAKLLNYTSLCWPTLEYAHAVLDPSTKNKIHDDIIEPVQNSAIRLISNFKGCTDSVSETRNQLQLQSVEDRRKNQGLCFLTLIFQNEELHRILIRENDEIARDRLLVTVTTRAAAKGEPISISTKKSVFHSVSCHEWFMRCVKKITNNIS